MSAQTFDNIEFAFKSDLLDLGTMSLRALRRVDDTTVRAALDLVVRQSGQSTRSIGQCSNANGIN